MPDEATLVHELSHMWFGDSVTLTHVARHLAPRGLRHLVRVDLERVPGQQVGGPVVQGALQHPCRRTPRSGHPRRALPASPAFLMFNGTIYYRGAMYIALGSATREDRRPHLLPAACATGPRKPIRQRHHGPIHRAGTEQVSGMRAGRSLLRRLAVPTRQAGLLVTARRAPSGAPRSFFSRATCQF